MVTAAIMTLMRRTTVSLEDPTLRELHRVATQRGVSVAALIREAVQKSLETQRPRPQSAGIGASGRCDISKRAGEERAEPRSWR